jgi:GGDEF domain-containing protein
MLPGPPRRRRARPVADAPIDALLPLAEDLAKGWLLALLEQAPLDEAPSIMAADLPRDGPRVCQAVLRAVADDTDLRRLEPGGALTPLAARVGELAGASGPETTSRAVDALHAVIWAALRDELRAPDPSLISELAERLTQVTDLLRSAALRRGEIAGDRSPVRGLSAVGVATTPPAGPSPFTRPSPFKATPSPSKAAPSPSGESSSAGEPSPSAEPSPGAGPKLAPPLWVGALQEEIERAAGGSLSLLLAELEDAERITTVEPGSEVGATFGEFARAVRSAVRRQDILVCETSARAWIIARETARPGAQALGWRIVEAVRDARSWRGAPLASSVGVAVLGEDGRSPEELMDAAEEARFAAAAAGIGVIRAVPDDRFDG